MFKLAVSAKNLEKLYALYAIPVGEGTYLTDTKEGQNFLYQIGFDLYSQIRTENEMRIPDDDWINEKYNEGILNEIYEKRDQYVEEYIEKLMNDYDLSDDKMYRSADDLLLKNIERLARDMDVEFEDAFERRYGRLDHSDFIDSYKDTNKNALRDILSESNDLEEIRDHLTNNIIAYLTGSTINDELLYDFVSKKFPYDEFKAQELEETEIHFEIERLMKEFYPVLQQARRSGQPEDYQNLMVMIDRVMQQTHHGGMVLDYAMEGDSGQYDDVMHGRSGPFFMEQTRAKGLIPEDAEKHLNYLDPIEYEEREDYYKDPKFSDRRKYLKENAPLSRYNRYLTERMTPNQIAQMNAAEVYHLTQKRMGEGNDLERLREMEAWSNDWLGGKMKPFKFASSSRLVKLANKIDSLAYDLGDKLDRILRYAYLNSGWIDPDGQLIEIDEPHDDWASEHAADFGLEGNHVQREDVIGHGWCRVFPALYSCAFTFPFNLADNILPKIRDYVYDHIKQITVPLHLEATGAEGYDRVGDIKISVKDFLSSDLDEIKRKLTREFAREI